MADPPLLAYALLLALLAAATIITLFPVPLPSARRATLAAIFAPQQNKRTPLELVRASQRAREREAPRRLGRQLSLGNDHPITNSRPDLALNLPATPTSTTSTAPQLLPPQPNSQQSDIRAQQPRKQRRADRRRSPPSSSFSSSTAPSSAQNDPPSSRITQTFSLELDPELLSLLSERSRRQRANSLPSPPRPPRKTGALIAATATATSQSGPGGSRRHGPGHGKRLSSLDPYAPEFTPASSLSLSLSLSL
ncbi:hypothetical protein CALVIDRAFT_183053 [Calocera viscosa TUFC12733]|uniref:Uncharacterized protein n=1 Tax=Calocera viscosa (strain TUFC12733) TaxID=1330018 RepID=A0A167L238_CALVF|nr:hypothetical protein CALVIDRAFT_183053 [Calocera viscosa TUFC12733]